MNKNAHRNAEDSRSRRAMVGSKLSFSASESYKLLRTNVMFSLAEDEDGSRIFGITSPIKGEGKSTTAINLAYSIAESAKRVLLIEMDMRLPVLHKSLPISKAPGLSLLLAAQAVRLSARMVKASRTASKRVFFFMILAPFFCTGIVLKFVGHLSRRENRGKVARF